MQFIYTKKREKNFFASSPPESPSRGCVSVWLVSLPRAPCAGGREVLGGAAGCPPGAAGEGDAGGEEDGVPPTGEARRLNN